ncbi:mapmodulin-like protein [Perkinsela sp. CCAP 1560/4]|nr:mapmodulin-like protein [Perkinsela sp. CCAP 1560/4]|eukprot:KNH04048.1 mapmodulin-like protein [Perkinsela sp. CCAP 1560/4]
MSEPALREYTRRQVFQQTKNQTASEVHAISLASGFFEGMSSMKDYINLRRLDLVAMNPRITTQNLLNDPEVSFKSLKQLNLNDNALVSLPASFAAVFPAVRKIELSNNLIGKGLSNQSGSEEQAILDVLGPLTLCNELKVLDLESNPICQLGGYREILFRLLPSLQVLDSKNKAGENVDSSDELSSDQQGSSSEEGEEDSTDDFMEDDEEDDEQTEESSGKEDETEESVDNPVKKMKIQE